MNNYCTNCGEKLSEDDIVCSKCGCPVVALPEGYVPIKTKARRNKNSKIVKICVIVAASILIIFFFD